MVTPLKWGLAVALYPKLAYKPEVDFEPISIVSAFAMVILARKDFPPNDLKEFASFVKANSNQRYLKSSASSHLN
jgi:tripartite-type tricarboxylate transporter receptor subunit TctC